MGKIKAARSLRDDYYVLVTYGDIHLPRHDRSLCNILLDIIADQSPDVIIDGGDVICADCLSLYPKKKEQLTGLQYELDLAFNWMTQVNSAAPAARKILLQDNHFWRRLENKKKGEYWLEDLEATDGANLLRLDELHWEPMIEYLWKNTILFMHGDDKEGSGDCPANRVRKLVQSNGLSVVRYHTHVSGIEIHRHMKKELFAIQLGSFEDLGHKDNYMKHPITSNWSASIGIFYLSKKDSEFLYNPVLFRNGKAVVDGKIYG